MRELGTFLAPFGAALLVGLGFVLIFEIASRSKQLRRVASALSDLGFGLADDMEILWKERRWRRQRRERLLDGVEAMQARALFLHELEFELGRGLIVTHEKHVYVTSRQLRQINRYLRRNGAGTRAATRTFAHHGYRLYATQSR